MEWGDSASWCEAKKKKTQSVDYLHSRSASHLNHLLVLKLHKEIHFCSQNASLLTPWISFSFWGFWPTDSSVIERYCQWWRLMMIYGSSLSKVITQHASFSRMREACSCFLLTADKIKDLVCLHITSSNWRLLSIVSIGPITLHFSLKVLGW